ncbi:hypothetical protein [Clostridium frigidicarnis]|uniref:Uncharacterized protein n=1 Tax=Clostridium frigidicarnis TaxID=84698 RepID=A0A1I1A0L7_9CLOT|nr:hypothetical protein [Clostridium frigidicarnis]SFB31112.1 hypothetical protein SAMN04488528_10284 [Clostridium frigidicarnis]
MVRNYYDNSIIKADEKGRVFIDRIYCLDFHKFNDDLWNKLGHVYNSLPYRIDTSFPNWYGIEGESESYLWASVESSGLQISGELKEVEWNAWVKILNECLNMFPLFQV